MKFVKACATDVKKKPQNVTRKEIIDINDRRSKQDAADRPHRPVLTVCANDVNWEDIPLTDSFLIW